MKDNTIYALGFFDGVHLGHAALLAACRRLADERGCKAGVVTFSNHPDELVFGKAPALINSLQDRDWLLKEKFHMDTVISLPFDEPMMTMPWQDFYGLLRREYGAAGLVCGEDFRFGSRGEGSGEKLTEVCTADGIPCSVVSQLRLNGQVVSSTHIRALIEDGQMEEAVRFLGHPHVLTGRVVHGHQLGRTLGIPTANLLLPEGLVVPKFGVYACLAEVEGQKYPAVANIGTRPTVGGTGITVEPWILDFEGDLYGKEIRLEFCKFLRPEQKFPDLAALQREIRKNAEETRAFFQSK
ncbi:MAG: bifunctional riboflavin kinase/FAD synthetase [Oscillospiraceae bacterium]|nr:bifunctional riboflavin kinase/FAD synthetase [Oscillospiraceae bacterium]